MERIPRAGVLVLLLAVAVTFARDESLRKDNYAALFTERTAPGGHVRHPGNAFSSLAFAAVGLWLSRVTVATYAMARQSDVVVLLWLCVVSFRFHATESLWIETQDLWCVVYLCVSCLSRYIARTDSQSVLFTWVAMGALLVDAVAQPVGRAVVEQHYIGIVGVLVYALLWFSQSCWCQFAALLVAYIGQHQYHQQQTEYATG